MSICLSNCYTYSLVADKDADSVIHHRATRWSAFWGIVQSKDINAECDEGAISNVKVDKSFFHDLVTIASAGTASPVTLEWDCKPEETSDDTLPDPHNNN